MHFSRFSGILWCFLILCGSSKLDKKVEELLQREIQSGPADMVEKLKPQYEKLRQDPMDKVSYNNIGDVYFKYDMLEDARLMFDIAIRIDSTYIPALFNQSVIEMKEKQYQAGVNLLCKIIQIDPTNIKAITNLSDYYYKTGQLSKALEYTTLAFNLQPVNSQMAYNLAVIYLTMEDTTMGTEYLEKALQLDPQNQTAHQRLNMILYEKKSTKKPKP